MKIAALVGSVLLVLPLAAQAGDVQQASGRTISYRVVSEVLERNAENKPVKGNFERVGVTLHEAGPGAGTFTQIRILGAWERTAEGGVYSGTLDRSFADETEQQIAFEGRFGKGRAQGTYECAGGTGKYATAKCGGTYESQSFKNGMAANRWTGTIEFAE